MFQKEELQKEIALYTEVLDGLQGTEGAIMPALQKMQEIFGYIPREMVDFTALKLDVFSSQIYGVATFYSQFRLEPAGKHVIMLCQGTACHVLGSAKIEEVVTEALGIKDGETTPDGLFTLENVACLGCCSLAPVMMIDGEAYGSLTPESTRQILADIAEKERVAQ